MRMGTVVATAALTLLVATGCGSDDSSDAGAGTEPSSEAAEFPEDTFSERDVIDHLGLVDGGYAYRADGLDCDVAVVLTNPNQVSMYADAGDVVATDPQQRVGVKLVDGVDPVETCFGAITAALDDFDA